MVEVSQSKIKIWNRCRYAYSLRYNERLKRKRKSRPLTFGTIMHTCLEAQAEKQDPFEALNLIEKEQGHMFTEEIEELGDIINDTRYILSDYLDWDKGSGLQFNSYQGKRAEHNIKVEVAEGVDFVAKIDALARTPNKLNWLLENKTFSNMPNDDHRWRDLQSAVYIRLLEILGYKKLDGLCWNYVYSKPPSSPKINKDGSMSKAALVTLPSKVRDFCKEHKINPKDIPEVFEQAEKNLDRYFQRKFVPVKRKAVDIIFKDAVKAAIAIRDDPKEHYPRTIERHCDWCDFEPICRAELQGHDVDIIKEREYAVSKGKNEDSKKEDSVKKGNKKKAVKRRVRKKEPTTNRKKA